jgi:hypothetical protein
MDEKLFYWVSVVVALASLVLLVADISLVNGNRSLQEKIAERQVTIQRGGTLAQINQALVQMLAEASVKNNDADIRNLLAEQGITVKPKTADKAADDTAAPTKETKKK